MNCNHLIIVIVIVQGFCCPLQQRPSSGRVTHRVTPQSREAGDGSLTLLSSLKGRSRTGSRPEITPEGGAPTVSHHGDPVCETAGERITHVHTHVSSMLTDESVSLYSVGATT